MRFFGSFFGLDSGNGVLGVCLGLVFWGFRFRIILSVIVYIILFFNL